MENNNVDYGSYLNGYKEIDKQIKELNLEERKDELEKQIAELEKRIEEKGEEYYDSSEKSLSSNLFEIATEDEMVQISEKDKELMAIKEEISLENEEKRHDRYEKMETLKNYKDNILNNALKDYTDKRVMMTDEFTKGLDLLNKEYDQLKDRAETLEEQILMVKDSKAKEDIALREKLSKSKLDLIQEMKEKRKSISEYKISQDNKFKSFDGEYLKFVKEIKNIEGVENEKNIKSRNAEVSTKTTDEDIPEKNAEQKIDDANKNINQPKTQEDAQKFVEELSKNAKERLQETLEQAEEALREEPQVKQDDKNRIRKLDINQENSEKQVNQGTKTKATEKTKQQSLLKRFFGKIKEIIKKITTKVTNKIKSLSSNKNKALNSGNEKENTKQVDKDFSKEISVKDNPEVMEKLAKVSEEHSQNQENQVDNKDKTENSIEEHDEQSTH